MASDRAAAEAGSAGGARSGAGEPGWWGATVALVVAVAAARIAYLALWCPYTLVEDEAHYWEWSRRLEWSYYSKGPGVAWAIAASSWAFRQLGVAVSEFVVRLPSALCGAVLMLAVAALARDAAGGRHEPTGLARRAGFFAAACVLLAPAYQFGALLMTIDVPYAACWALAALAGLRAMRGGSRWAWVGLGAALGTGFLFKYTIMLLVPGLALYGVVTGRRGQLRLAPGWGRWMLAGGVAAAAGLAPVIIWNAGHGWVTVRHLLGHLGLTGGDVDVPAGRPWRYKPQWTLELIGSQLGLIGPLLAVMVWAAGRSFRNRRVDPAVEGGWADRSYLIWCAAPIFVFYLCVSFIAEPEGNWPLAGYVTLFALAGIGVAEGGRPWRDKIEHWKARGRPGGWWRRPRPWPHAAWRASVVVGIMAAVLTARVDLIAQSAALRWAQHELVRRGLIKQDRQLIPLGRLMGAREMARGAERLLTQAKRDTGLEPFLVAQQYGRASTLAFYMEGQPTVYSSSSKGYGRRTQYDLWDDTDLDDPALLGRPAVLVGGWDYEWEHAFERLELVGQLDGETKRDRLTFIGYGFKGFVPLRPAAAPGGTP